MRAAERAHLEALGVGSQPGLDERRVDVPPVVHELLVARPLSAEQGEEDLDGPLVAEQQADCFGGD